MEIEAKEIQSVLSGNHILKGVDLKAGRQELLGVIGPNGSGKSTLLKCIYRVLKPTAGAVYLDGNAPGAAELPQVRPGRWPWWRSIITIILTFAFGMWC